MWGGMGQFKRNQTTFAPACTVAGLTEGVMTERWLRALTGAFWWGTAHLSEHNSAAGEVAVLTPDC